jgi:uncharacterized protein
VAEARPDPLPCVRETAPGRCRLDLSVAPNARTTAVAGLHDGALRVRLAAQPIDGAANEALLRWLARQLGLSKSQLRLVQGASARRKCVEIDLDMATVAAWLAAALDPEQ